MSWLEAAPASYSPLPGVVLVSVLPATLTPIESVQATASGVRRGSAKSVRRTPSAVQASATQVSALVAGRTCGSTESVQNVASPPLRSLHLSTQAARASV